MNDKEKMMRKIGMKMSICMGITLSFFLSLVGVSTSGHFTIPGWIVSFIISTVISLVIGFFVPMKKVSDAVLTRFNMQPGRLSSRLLEALISDLIYTPVITFCMVFAAYKKAVSMGAPVRFLPMFLSSLAVCMVVGFILIFIFMPFYMKLIIGNSSPDTKKDRPEK